MEENTPEEIIDQEVEADEDAPQRWAEQLIIAKLSENSENGLSEQVLSSIIYIYAMKEFAGQDELSIWKEAKTIRSILNRLKREGQVRFSSNRWHIS